MSNFDKKPKAGLLNWQTERAATKRLAESAKPVNPKIARRMTSRHGWLDRLLKYDEN